MMNVKDVNALLVKNNLGLIMKGGVFGSRDCILC